MQIRAIITAAVLALALGGCSTIDNVKSMAHEATSPAPPPPPEAVLHAYSAAYPTRAALRDGYLWPTPTLTPPAVELAAGTPIAIIGKMSGEWLMVEVDGHQGYVETSILRAP